MKKTLGVMLLATLMAGCANTTSLNKDTTIGDLLGIGPISMPTGYGQAATTKPQHKALLHNRSYVLVVTIT